MVMVCAALSGRQSRNGAQRDAGTSGKRRDARCRPESAALRVAPRRPPAASRASTVFPDTLFGPLLADRTPGRDAGRDHGEKLELYTMPPVVLTGLEWSGVCNNNGVLGILQVRSGLETPGAPSRLLPRVVAGVDLIAAPCHHPSDSVGSVRSRGDDDEDDNANSAFCQASAAFTACHRPLHHPMTERFHSVDSVTR